MIAAQGVFAHAVSGGGGLGSGFKHPWSGADHVIAMVAVGLWGAQLGKPAIWLLPIVFPLVMAVGGFLGLIEIPLPGVELGIATSGLLLGLMVALAVRPRTLIWPATLVGVFGLFHGHAHGAELPQGGSGLLYSVGFVIATGILHGCGIAIGEVFRYTAGKIVLRLLGALIAMGGAWFVFQTVRGEPEARPLPADTHPVRSLN
jgi:urease accessory protein